MNRCPYSDLIPGMAPRGADVVELKHDGIWGRAEIVAGECTIYSRTGRPKATLPVDPRLGSLTLVGEYMYGTPWSREDGRSGRLYVFDIEAGATTLDRRRRALQKAFGCLPLPPWMRLVDQYPIRRWRDLWTDHVETGRFEGLVFKRSDGCYGEPWGRMKARVIGEFVCMGVNRGRGRHRDSAGSLQGGLYVNGALKRIVDVGTGFEDDERAEIWESPSDFIGRVFEVCGNARFPSGALRHPRFEGWRNDKAACECVAA